VKSLSHLLPRSLILLVKMNKSQKLNGILLCFAFVLSACEPQGTSVLSGAPQGNLPVLAQQALSTATPIPEYSFTPRPLYSPGELVDYTAQTGDTLPVLAIRFNTSVDQIMKANLFIPASATTMPPGMPMKIPIYYLPLWGPSYKIIPDSLFIDGPSQVQFNTVEFVANHPGWLKGFVDYVADANRNGAEIIDYVALRYSVSPMVLLALLEYQTHALSEPVMPPEIKDYPLGYLSWDHKGLYMQLVWAANLLNNGYYSYRQGEFTSITYKDGRLERFDPWLNATTASLHNYFNQLFGYEDYIKAISPDGFAKTFQDLFGDPWKLDQPHIPGSLVQPEFTLPFLPGGSWALTGGPHTGWGLGEPFAALDFAPPSVLPGCVPNANWATAMAPGKVVRTETGVVLLDLDGDGDERTGWVIFYLHIATDGRVPLGAELKRGDAIGHPSCEGGDATGSHVHVARKYNGEWVPAEGILAFNMEGWIAHSGGEAYLGTLTRNSQEVVACVNPNSKSFLQSEIR
jgi:LasA protease